MDIKRLRSLAILLQDQSIKSYGEKGIAMTATEELVSRIKRGEVLCTWDVNHTALATALAKDLVIVTDDCRLKLYPGADDPREELGDSIRPRNSRISTDRNGRGGPRD